MKLLPRRIAPLALLLALTVPAAAHAAPTPGTVTLDNDWHSTFTFTQAADEDNAAINVALGSEVDERGEIKGSREYASLTPGQASYRTTDPLYAGAYSWQLTSWGTADVDYRIGAISQFTVPAILAKPKVTFACTGRRNLALVGSWRTNVENLKVSYKILMGRRVVDNVRNYPIWTSNANIGKPDSKTDRYEPFLASRFAKNTKFTVAYSITGPGVSYAKNLVAVCR